MTRSSATSYLTRVTAVAALCAAGVGPSRGLTGQITDRVRGVRNGTIRMTFAARPGVCWYGDGRRFSTSDRSDQNWVVDCEEGPVRVVIEVRNGEYVNLHTYVGGRWRGDVDGVDLGSVSAPSAATFLLDLARTAEPPVADKAILPATLADSVTVWAHLETLARDVSRPNKVREAAVFWMGQTDDVATVRILGDMIESDSETSLRERAVFALSQHQSDSAGNVLYRLAVGSDHDMQLRDRAIFWLGQRRWGPGVDLRSLFDRIESPELRERIIFAASQRGGTENANWLLEVAKDPTQPLALRKQAVFWTGQRVGDISGLVTAYDQIEDPTLREHMLFVFSQRHNDPSALDKLIEVASGSSDAELRRKAIFWLGQSRDPKAIGFLEELISR